MTDLAKFLTRCCDGEVRRQAEFFIIPYYLEYLTENFGGDLSRIPYNAEKLQKSYDLCFLCPAFTLPGMAMM